MRARIPLPALVLCALGACGDGKEYQRHLASCDAATAQGLLATAASACRNALEIAERDSYPEAKHSAILYQLGRLERQRGRFSEAERLLRESLALERRQPRQNAAAIADRLLELALSLAGEARWGEGSEVMRQLLPLSDRLAERVRDNFANVVRNYNLHLRSLDQPELSLNGMR